MVYLMNAYVNEMQLRHQIKSKIGIAINKNVE